MLQLASDPAEPGFVFLHMSSFLFYILSYTSLGLQGQDGHRFCDYRIFAMLSIVKQGCSNLPASVTLRHIVTPS